MTDLPIIQFHPGPTDEQLEVERDTKHAAAVKDWFAAESRRAVALTMTVAIATAPTAEAVPLIGGNGLCPNASALADYITVNYPAVRSIGGVRADSLPDHPSGHALDIMVGSDTALGNQIAADIRSQSARFGVEYVIWQQPAHFDHIHVTVS